MIIYSLVVYLPRFESFSCSISGSNYCFLTRIQISQAMGKMVWCSHLSESFLQFVMIHTVKAFSIVNQTEIDIFLKFPSFLYNPANVGNLIPNSSAFSKPSLDIWKFLVHIMLKPSRQGSKRDLTSTGDECGCSTVSTLSGTTLRANWEED